MIHLEISAGQTDISCQIKTMKTTYPKARQISIGYDQIEDRMVFTSRFKDGLVRKALITRRLLSRLLIRMSRELYSTHPVAGRSPDPDEVLQMEHIAAIAHGLPETQALPERPGAQTTISQAGLVVDVQIETQDEYLVLGLLSYPAEPIAAMKLTREKAHQLIRTFMEKAAAAEWDLENKAPWLEPMICEHASGKLL